MRNFARIGILFLLFGVSPAAHSQIIDSTSTPEELWQRVRKTLPPMEVSVTKDEIVESLTDPRTKLRRIEFTFVSQEIEGRKWIHPCVVFLPVKQKDYLKPGRRGKIVIVTHPNFHETDAFVMNYGDPVATLTGYPTLVMPNPGVGRESDFGAMIDREKKKLLNDPSDHNYFRMAVPCLLALDIMADILKINKNEIRAIIGGHSKRATGAYVAAAIDRERIAGVVYMGNESLWGITEGYPAVCPGKIQQWVKARVLYIGASNEFYRPGKYEYHMYNINRIQETMGGAWTIEYIPNYIHYAMSEKHFIDWRMWVSHVFDGRPVTEINDMGYRVVEGGTIFRVHVQSPNTVIHVKLWHVYNGDEPPYWIDLFWKPNLMEKKENGYYEGFVGGKLPDAWIVEVKDIARGIPGYVSSLPQDITGKRNVQDEY